MKILLTGSTGVLGSECEAVLKDDYNIIAPKRMNLILRIGIR